MLYTSMPLERIYSNQVKSLIIPKNGSSSIQSNVSGGEEYKILDISHGKVYTKKEGDSYVVHGISSTNLEDYLNPKYSMGAIIDI